MAYLEMRIKMSEPPERLVNLAMDEVYTSKSVEMVGGRVYGETEWRIVTKTLFCTRINCIAGKYEDMVSMTPVSHVTKEDIKLTFNNVVQVLLLLYLFTNLQNFSKDTQ